MARIPWAKFCWKGEGRCIYAFKKPFVQDGYLYASDGRVAVRRPTGQKPHTIGHLPVMSRLPWDHARKRKWCVPEKIITEGGLWWPTGEPLRTKLRIGKAWFDGWRIELLANLPQVLVHPPFRKLNTLLFRFSGRGEGLLMPMECPPEQVKT